MNKEDYEELDYGDYEDISINIFDKKGNYVITLHTASCEYYEEDGKKVLYVTYNDERGGLQIHLPKSYTIHKDDEEDEEDNEEDDEGEGEEEDNEPKGIFMKYDYC